MSRKIISKMKISDKPKIQLPETGMDPECIEICNTLNRLPDTETFESCCGHGERPFWVFFRCTNIDVLSRLGRAVERNYSDGKWEIVIDSSDTNPRGVFWLRTKTTLNEMDLSESLDNLIDNILYWFNDEFDNHFKGKQDD